jgi:hypothetical protein
MRIIYFRDDKLNVGMTTGIDNEFQAQKFPLNSFKNGDLSTLVILLETLITGDSPRIIYFRDDNLHVGMTAGIDNEFQAQKFPLKSFKNGDLSTLVILLETLITGDSPRIIYFRDDNLHVGMAAGINNEFQAQKFPLNCNKNGQSGSSGNSASDSHYSRQTFIPENNIFLR